MYLLLAALFGLFFSTNTFAQDLENQFEWDKISRDGYTVDHENPLITDAEQFSSPFSQNDLGSRDGADLVEEAALIDEDPSTYWHSVWSGSNVPDGLHYFQVEMTDDLDPDTDIAFVFTRRNTTSQNDITRWLILGTDDPEAREDECDEIAEISTPFDKVAETLMSTPFKRGEYMYLRFCCLEQTKGDKFFHLAEFNIFPAVKMEELDMWIKEADAAYEKYFAHYDDFTDLTGTMPGQYSEEAVLAFQAVCDAYTDATEEQLNDVEFLKKFCEDIKATYDAIAPTKVPFLSKDLPAGSGYYRIRAGMEYESGDKYMYGAKSDDGSLSAGWGTPDFDDSKDNIQILWKIEIKSDTTYDVVNVFNEGRFMKVARSTGVEMTTDPAYADSLLAFDAAGYDNDYERAYVNIRLNMQAANDFFYLHQNNHSDGSGTGSNLVGWENTFNGMPRASEWWFEEVPEAEAEAIIKSFNRDEDAWKTEFAQMMKTAPGMIEVAIDIAQVPIVTDAAQLSSPYSDSSEGQHIEYLIDGKTDNFWHTSWHSSDNVPEGNHYLQIKMPEGVADKDIYMQFTRRSNADNDHTTLWSIRGTNDEEWTDEEECEEILSAETPFGSKTETLKTETFKPGDWKYLRIYSEDQYPSSRTYWHVSELNLFYDVDNPNSQYIVMGDVAKTLEKLVNDFKDIETEDLDKATHYDPLKAAYDAFVAIYVNPKALRDTIALAEASVEQVVEGTDPGFWPVGTATNLNKLITDAKAYDKAGAYTPAKSDAFNAQLNAQMKAIDTAPIKVKTGKWYRLRFGTEAEYDKYGWSKTGNFPNYEIDNTDPEDPDTLGMYNAGNFGKYIAVAKRENVVIEKTDGTEANGSLIKPIAKEEVMLETSIHGIDLAELTDPDMGLWRFVNIGDSAYAIQNKATGLFISHGGSLNVQPGLFTQHPSGYGQNAFFIKKIDGQSQSPLHLAQSQTVLCAWGNESGSGWTDADGRRGSFFVEEVADVAADYAFGECQMSLTPGDIYGRCFPVPVTLKNTEDATLWTVAKLERTPGADESSESVSVTLAKMDPAVPAGRPFFIVAKGEMPEEGDEYDPIIAKFGFTFNLINTPQTSGYLKGAFVGHKIPVKCLTTGSGHEEDALVWKSANWDVSDNRVYITDIDEENEGFLRKAELEITFDGNLEDGIASAIQKVSRVGGIFTIDGRRIGNGNLNTISNLPKGAYILNGQKVIVK